MHARPFLLLVLLSIWTLASCAKMELATQGLEFTLSEDKPQPPSTPHATILFVREESGLAHTQYFVWENGRTVGALKDGSQFVLYVTPGKHTYQARTEVSDFVTVQAEEGVQYCVFCSSEMGLYAGRPTLKISDMDVCNFLSDGLPFTSLTETGAARQVPVVKP